MRQWLALISVIFACLGATNLAFADDVRLHHDRNGNVVTLQTA